MPGPRIHFLLTALAPCFLAAAGAAAQPGPVRPMIGPYRIEENWTVLRDPALRTDRLDAIKYIPLGAQPGAVLTLGGEFRHRWEYYRNDGWGALPVQDGNGYHLLRAMLHADLRTARGWRTYVDLKSGVVRGSSTVIKPPDRDDLDLHQAFVEWSGPVAGRTLLARLGRQEFNYGSSRILTFRDGPNVRQSFDAGLLRWSDPQVKWDAFYARPAETDPGIFDDQTSERQLIYGVYRTEKVAWFRGATLDLYFMGYEREGARFQAGVGRESRNSLGVRFAGRRGAFDYNFEALGQWGDFQDGEIRAWTFASDSGYTFSTTPGRPRAFIKANIISGDRRPNDGRLQTFNALFPRGSYFGDIGQLGPANLINLHPGIGGTLAKRWVWQVAAVFYWRESDRDGLYNAGGVFVRDGQTSRANYIGTQADATLAWNVNRNLSIEGAYSRFWVGKFLRESGTAEDVDYAALTTRFRF